MESNSFERFSGLISTANKSIMKLKRRRMEKYDLSGAHTNCIYRLYKYRDTGLTQKAIMELEQMDRAQVSRVIRDLEQSGYVTSENSGGYKSVYGLTEAGLKVGEKINATVSEYMNSVSEAIPEEKLVVFYEVLAEINEMLAKLTEGSD